MYTVHMTMSRDLLFVKKELLKESLHQRNRQMKYNKTAKTKKFKKKTEKSNTVT